MSKNEHYVLALVVVFLKALDSKEPFSESM